MNYAFHCQGCARGQSPRVVIQHEGASPPYAEDFRCHHPPRLRKKLEQLLETSFKYGQSSTPAV